ncbi:MAG: hypothetical protein NVSMB1_18170 [Polyangiales bacterium]
MTRAQLEHIIRAAATIADDDEIIVIGSQSILGQFPNAPAAQCVSVVADVYPKNWPDRADLIDGSIGEDSPFHETFGYYAQGVGETTATLPDGWMGRLVLIRNANTRGASAWCLEVHDLLISKYVAGREKDGRFVAAAIAHGLVDRKTLETRLAATAIDAEKRAHIALHIAHHFAIAAKGGSA